ncbi:MAG: hypothetical protein ACTFAK_11995 [Candidatus Electronema sp. VV]
MATIQCRVEQNPLTTPESYKLRFIPRSTGGYDEVAARLAQGGADRCQQPRPVKVENDTELVALLRSSYRGIMVDILNVGM